MMSKVILKIFACYRIVYYIRTGVELDGLVRRMVILQSSGLVNRRPVTGRFSHQCTNL